MRQRHHVRALRLQATVAVVVNASLSLGFTLATRTVHPPARANPVIMVYAQAHWWALQNPVLLGVACLLCVAVAWSRVYPGLVHYSVSPREPSPPSLN
jgi:CBS-domain-containing membrane protein